MAAGTLFPIVLSCSAQGACPACKGPELDSKPCLDGLGEPCTTAEVSCLEGPGRAGAGCTQGPMGAQSAERKCHGRSESGGVGSVGSLVAGRPQVPGWLCDKHPCSSVTTGKEEKAMSGLTLHDGHRCQAAPLGSSPCLPGRPPSSIVKLGPVGKGLGWMG